MKISYAKIIQECLPEGYSIKKSGNYYLTYPTYYVYKDNIESFWYFWTRNNPKSVAKLVEYPSSPTLFISDNELASEIEKSEYLKGNTKFTIFLDIDDGI